MLFLVLCLELVISRRCLDLCSHWFSVHMLWPKLRPVVKRLMQVSVDGDKTAESSLATSLTYPWCSLCKPVVRGFPRDLRVACSRPASVNPAARMEDRYPESVLFSGSATMLEP